MLKYHPSAIEAIPTTYYTHSGSENHDPPAGLVKTFGFDETIQPMTTTPSAA